MLSRVLPRAKAASRAASRPSATAARIAVRAYSAYHPSWVSSPSKWGTPWAQGGRFADPQMPPAAAFGGARDQPQFDGPRYDYESDGRAGGWSGMSRGWTPYPQTQWGKPWGKAWAKPWSTGVPTPMSTPWGGRSWSQSPSQWQWAMSDRRGGGFARAGSGSGSGWADSGFGREMPWNRSGSWRFNRYEHMPQRYRFDPKAGRVYPQDMSVITQHMTESGVDAGLWKDLPHRLEHFELTETTEGVGRHCWLLNTRWGVTFLLLMAKKEKNIKFGEIARAIGRDEVWTTSALFGNQSFDEKTARKTVEMLGFHSRCADAMVRVLQCPPMRMACPVPDPTLKRIRELADLYSHPFKALIHEKLGDGVMSAADCKVTLKIRKSDASPWERFDPRTGRYIGAEPPAQYGAGAGAYGAGAYGSGAVGVGGGVGGGIGGSDYGTGDVMGVGSGDGFIANRHDESGPRICVSFEGAFVPFKQW